jgi:hypothetical protein
MIDNKDGTYTITRVTDFIGWEPVASANISADGKEAHITLKRTRAEGTEVTRFCKVKPATLLPVEAFQIVNKR